MLESLPIRQLRKTCKHKSKPISATNVAFRHTLGLLLCQMSRSYKTGTFEILKQPNTEEMSYYLLQSPGGVQHRGGGVMFSEINKSCARKKLALQTEVQMSCFTCRKRPALKKNLVCFKEELQQDTELMDKQHCGKYEISF